MHSWPTPSPRLPAGSQSFQLAVELPTAAFFGAVGAEVVEFGLLNRTIHKVDECCAVEDIDRLHRVFGEILRRVF